MLKLQTNVVRTYGIDPSRNHSECMTELANAGVYVLADLVAPGYTASDPRRKNVLSRKKNTTPNGTRPDSPPKTSIQKLKVTDP